jgi:biotin operon repressor
VSDEGQKPPRISATRDLARRSRRRSRRPVPGRICARCGALLALDNPGSICSAHRRLTGYRPEHDPSLDEKLLALLEHAPPEGIDLCAALGTDNHKAVNQGVVRLRKAGHQVEGLRPRGYRLANLE